MKIFYANLVGFTLFLSLELGTLLLILSENKSKINENKKYIVVDISIILKY